MKRPTETHRFDWNGILLEVEYNPNWLPAHIVGEDLAHLKVKSLYPSAAPLPVAKCGFYMQTLPVSTILAAGGPCAYVDIMLSAESEWAA